MHGGRPAAACHRAGIVHCWEKTKLLRAWEGTVQAEAARRAEELFPNLSDGDFLPADFKEDEEAGFMGHPFIQPEGDDEWVDRMCPGKRSWKRPRSSEAVWSQAGRSGVQVVYRPPRLNETSPLLAAFFQ